MKSLLVLLFTIAFLGANAQEDAIQRHFNDYLQDQRFTSAYISPKMFSVMAEKTDLAMEEDVRKMIRNMKSMRVVQQGGQDGASLYTTSSARLKKAKYEELMSLREKGEQIQFYTMGNGAKVNELVMVVGGPSRFLIMSMVGDIDLGTVAKLSKALNVQGADLLEKVKK